ncbi:MAG TPA: hypothetical protein VIK84_06910 [Haloplasmataceae bacterium]
MKENLKVKHMFPGGNTTKGFYSFFDQILSQNDANHIFSIKGGPGVGKSSVMKKIGKVMTDLGYCVEYHHCSSDPNSLDALVITDLKIALLDGTCPHIVDPENPGAVDEIINLGEYWNEEKLKSNKDNIVKVNSDIKRNFAKAYHYLKSAKKIYEVYEKTEKLAFKVNNFNLLKGNIINELFNNIPIEEKIGKERHLFSFALTPIGITQYRDTLINECQKRYIFKESIGATSEELMNEIKNEAIKRGLDVDCYHSPIKIEKIEDLIIPEIGVSLSAHHDYNKCEFDYDKEIDLKEFLDKEILSAYIDELNEDKEMFEKLLYKGLAYITKAKSIHDLLEEYYIPSMDFTKIDQLVNKLIDKILKYKK